MVSARTLLLLTLLAAGSALAASPLVSDIGAPTGSSAGEPFLFATRDGLLLSWLEPVANTKDTALRFALYQSGKWSPPRTVIQRSDFFINWADFPSIVEDANGALFAHWLQKSGRSTYAYDVMVAISMDAGKTWSKPRPLNRDGKKGEHGFVTLAALSRGGVGATWLDGRNMIEGKEEGDMTLRYATITAAGEIGSDTQVDDRTCECCTTGMAMVGGRPLIAYRDRSAEEVRDIAVVRRTAQGWSKPRVLHADGWKIAGCPVNGPQVDARGNHVAVAWFTGAGEHGRVYVAFSTDAGASFAKPIPVDDGTPAGRVDVVMTDADTAVVTWLEQTKGGAELRARKVERNRTSGAAVKVAEASTARAAGFARIALIGQDIYVAWTEQSSSAKRIRISRVRL
jgi:hypothetical protein